MDHHHVWVVWLPSWIGKKKKEKKKDLGSHYLAVTVGIPFSCCLLHAEIESG